MLCPRTFEEKSVSRSKQPPAQNPPHLTSKLLSIELIFKFKFVDKLHGWSFLPFLFFLFLYSVFFFFCLSLGLVSLNTWLWAWMEGRVLSVLEAKNHICSNGGAQSVSQSLIEAGTKLNCMTFEWSPGNQPCPWRGGEHRRSTHHSGQGLWWGAGALRNLKRTCSLSRLCANEGA